MRKRWRPGALVWLGAMMVAGQLAAAPKPPDHQWHILEYVHPAGAQRGTAVKVRLGVRNGGAEGASGLMIDGPWGLTVEDFQSTKDHVEATVAVAADAPLGRRMIRVRGGKGGLTNFRWFFVGALPEYVEEEKNPSVSRANSVTLPVVINGRIAQAMDQDCFRFFGKQGQPLVAAIMAHGLDAMGFDKNTRGFADLSLELLDANGRVLAAAGDTLGFDPVIRHRLPADGDYVVRVSGLGYRGFPQCVYRLTLGDLPYATAAFPSGVRRGVTNQVELSGINLEPSRIPVAIGEGVHPIHYLESSADRVPHDLALHVSDEVERIEREPNNDAKTAQALPLTGAINGRFLEEGDEDWYQLDLKKGERITLEIMAQRHFRSPIDTVIDVFDAKGKRITGNDDGTIFAGETTHDFAAFDSYLEFTAKQAGKHFFRIAEQTGASGPRTVYRLRAFPTEPDLLLYQWPDAVPIWGPGTTSAFLVEVIRLGGLRGTVELSIEGLPKGWTGSRGWSPINDYRGPRQALGTKALLTVTAPANAKVGDLAEFRVVGRVVEGDRSIVREAKILTLYMYSDPHKFRLSPIARAAVAPPVGPWLSLEIESLSVAPGDQLSIPVKLHDPNGKPDPGQLILNMARSHHIANFGSPVNVPSGTTDFAMPLAIPSNFKEGDYGLVVSRQWGSNYRGGLPGPCTPVIHLRVRTVTASD